MVIRSYEGHVYYEVLSISKDVYSKQYLFYTTNGDEFLQDEVELISKGTLEDYLGLNKLK